MDLAHRIDRLVGTENCVIFRVSGWIRGNALDTLRQVLSQERGKLAIDLQEVILVDREAVMFLADSEIHGIELRNCPAYVREWIDRETHSE